MTLPADPAAATLDRILARVDGLTQAEDRDLTSPMSPAPPCRTSPWTRWPTATTTPSTST